MLVPLKYLFPWILITCAGDTKNNACKNYVSYFFIENSSLCYYNPDIDSNMTGILHNHFMDYEIHKIVTEDDYILTAFRLPIKNPKGVIVLQHPLSTDSIVYVGHRHESLAFLLLQEGYEIWLPNNRGTPTSRGHLTLSHKHASYWNFSFHEIGYYDYSAILNYVHSQTNSTDIIYIGHSQGSTAALVYASLRSAEAKRLVKVFITMAPTSTTKYSSMRTLSSVLIPMYRSFFRPVLGRVKIVPYYQVLPVMFAKTVLANGRYKKYFIYLTSIMFGWTPESGDPEYVTAMIKHNLLGAPIKILYHYAQLFAYGEFKMFDYGPNKNLIRYNSTESPEYPLFEIQVPVHIICSDMDLFMSLKDCDYLLNKLSLESRIYGVHKLKNMNHIDYFYGKQRKEQVYDYLMNFLQRIK